MKPVRERRCIATGDVAADHELVRVALAPDGHVVPDVAAKLPGRGAWLRAERAAVDKAVAKRLFSRAFGQEARADAALADRFAALLAERALSSLGLARRAGRLAVGYDAVRLALGAKRAPAWWIEASDGSADGRSKLGGLARHWAGLRAVSCFDAQTLGEALGRAGVVHATLEAGPEAEAFSVWVGKLAGFTPINPLKIGAEHG